MLQDYLNTKSSVEKYGGFYIARFEAGKVDGQVVSKKDVDAWVSVGYVEAKKLADEMYYQSDIQSALTTGQGWDTMLSWLSSTGIDVNNSTTYGNHQDTVAPANVEGYGALAKTGHSEYWKTNNIYDLAGNAWEWAAEVSGGSASLRSGNANWGEYPMTYRYMYGKGNGDSNISYRTTLFIKEKEPEKESSYSEPYIPNGFSYKEGEWETGLVIEDNVGNEFVWVPVDKTNVTYEKDYTYASNYSPTASNTSDDTLPAGLNEYNSVEKYGGFYIARYETGSQNSQAVSKKGVSVYTNLNYYQSKALAEQMYKNQDVQSVLTTGAGWDAVMDWLAESGIDVRNSATYGNYIYSLAPANVTGSGTPTTTGFSEYWKTNNIYDLAGNMWEWTNEIGSGAPIIRSGNYSWGDFPISIRYNYAGNSAASNVGFRVSIYIK